MENWKLLEWTGNTYSVSSKGRVRSERREVKNRHATRVVKPRILKPAYNRTTGYLQVGLSFNGKSHTRSIQVLVAEAFLLTTKTKERNEVNHKDGNKFNNRVDNLEYVSGSYNTIHAIRNGYRTKQPSKDYLTHPKKLNRSIAEEIRELRANGSSVKFLQAKYKVSRVTISKVINYKIYA